MWETILQSLQTNGLSLITMGGKIHPYLGAAVALILSILLIYLAIKAKAEKWENEKKKSGEVISDGTSNSQDTSKKVGDAGDDFLDGK